MPNQLLNLIKDKWLILPSTFYDFISFTFSTVQMEIGFLMNHPYKMSTSENSTQTIWMSTLKVWIWNWSHCKGVNFYHENWMIERLNNCKVFIIIHGRMLSIIDRTMSSRWLKANFENVSVFISPSKNRLQRVICSNEFLNFRDTINLKREKLKQITSINHVRIFLLEPWIPHTYIKTLFIKRFWLFKNIISILPQWIVSMTDVFNGYK